MKKHFAAVFFKKCEETMDRPFFSHYKVLIAQIAQLVEQGTENPCVAGSIPALGTIFCLQITTFLFPNQRRNFRPSLLWTHEESKRYALYTSVSFC